MTIDKIILKSLFFNNVSLAEAGEEIKSLSRDQPFSYVVTPNIDHLARVLGQADNDLKKIYNNAAVSLCDSRIIEKTLRFKGFFLKEVIPGSTLTEYLFDSIILSSDKVLIIGVEDDYIHVLRQKYPSMNIIHINPSMGFINKAEEVESIIKQVQSFQANYVFLSVGSPRQEILASKIQQAGSVQGVGLCVGASVLFLVNAEKRAPGFIQYLHLEWAFRMLQDPKRLAVRYFKNFLALPSIIKNL